MKYQCENYKMHLVFVVDPKRVKLTKGWSSTELTFSSQH